MNEEIKEKISAMIDDELPNTEQLIDAIICDGKAKAYWTDLHLARDISQGVDCTKLDKSFSSSVMLALDDEETYSQVEDVVHVDFVEKRRSPVWLRPAAGFAIAASVAALSVFGLRSIQTIPIEPKVQPLAQNQISRTSQRQLQPRVSDFKQVNNTGTYWVVDDERALDSRTERQLNVLLTNHLEFSSMPNVGGVLPYSRLVGYDEPVK